MRTRRRGSIAALGAALALMLSVLGAGLAPTAQARDAQPAWLTIHNRICPQGYKGTDLYRDCHQNPAPAGLRFTVRGPVTERDKTDRAGNVDFALQSGRYAVRGGVPGEFATLRVFCAPAAQPGTRYPFTYILGGVRGPNDPTGIRINLGAGDRVICDWYNIPESQR